MTNEFKINFRFISFYLYSWICFVFCGQKVDAVECDLEPKNNEGRLRKDLFCDYDRDNRPTLEDKPITIRIKMIVKGFTFDDSQGTLIMATWLAMVRFIVFLILGLFESD